MKATFLSACALAAALTGAAAFAQGKGEADEAQSRAAPAKQTTASERKAARVDRRAANKATAKTSVHGEGKPESAGQAGAATAKQKQDARAERRATAADAVKKGQTSSGEK